MGHWEVPRLGPLQRNEGVGLVESAPGPDICSESSFQHTVVLAQVPAASHTYPLLLRSLAFSLPLQDRIILQNM